MRTAIKKLLLHYFKEVTSDKDHSDENLESYADHFCDNIDRLVSARRDFKKED